LVTDPVGGYPLGTPAQGVHTWHGVLHDLPFSLFVFASLAAACFVFARRFTGWGERGWAIYSAVTGTLVVIGFFLSGQALRKLKASPKSVGSCSA
jgi:hypothetical protein